MHKTNIPKDTHVIPRYLNAEGLKAYLAVGRTTAERIAKEARARRKVGYRTIYDRELIDAYLAEIGHGE